MQRALLFCALATLVAAAGFGPASAGAFDIGTPRPVQFSEGREHAKAVRPQLLCIRTTPQFRKAGPPQGEIPDQPPLVDDILDVEVQRRVTIAGNARQLPSSLRSHIRNPRGPPPLPSEIS